MGRYLEYSLDTGVSGQLKFQITYQSPKVDRFFDFLRSIGKDSYLTKSGYKVAQSVFPEFKISTNTIYLRGALKSMDNKVDVTRFVNDGTYRKGSIKMFKEALEEFIGEVRRADNNGLLDNYSISYNYDYETPKSNPLAKLNILGMPVIPKRPVVSNTSKVYWCTPVSTSRSDSSRNVTVIYL